MSQTVLESIIDGLRPRRRKLITKERAVGALQLASRLMGVAVTRQPALVPIQGILEMLLQPTSNDAPLHEERVLGRIKKLRARMRGSNDIEQQQLRREIDALCALLIDED